MNERPIIFSGPMVQAILDGRKTQTRRVIKHQDLPGAPRSFQAYDTDDGRYGFDNEDYTWVCPYGKPGDLLYARETFCDACLNYTGKEGNEICHKSDGKKCRLCARENWPSWKPSIHMPKKYARIWLKVEAVRVERVQEISESDAEAEGIDFLKHVPDADETLNDRQVFRCLWDAINEKRGYGWDSNPWVWVVSFSVISTTGRKEVSHD